VLFRTYRVLRRSHAPATYRNWDRPCGEGIQADELIKWLTWIDSWATSTASREEEIQGHDKRQFDEAYAFPAHPCLAGLLICLGGVVRLGGQFNRIYSIIMNP